MFVQGLCTLCSCAITTVAAKARVQRVQWREVRARQNDREVKLYFYLIIIIFSFSASCPYMKYVPHIW